MNHTEIINALIAKFGYKSYLEIGTQRKKNNFDKIECQTKLSIDPDPTSDADLHLTSDEFFDNNQQNFDIIFVDGLHHEEQVRRDIVNAYCCLNDGGTIVVHDLLPTNELMQKVPREVKVWTGDGWRAWVKLRRLNEDLQMFVVDSDFGCGIVRHGQQERLKINQNYTYSDFEVHKEEWMNIITVEQFKEWMR